MSNNEIQTAIENSIKTGQRVSVDAGCTVDNLWALLEGIIVGQDYWDTSKLEDNKVYVWGWTSDTPEDTRVWRLTVRCQPEQVGA